MKAHPHDQAKVAAALRDMRSRSDGAMVEHRIPKTDGKCIWVETSLRTIRDPATRAGNVAEDFDSRRLLRLVCAPVQGRIYTILANPSHNLFVISTKILATRLLFAAS